MGHSLQRAWMQLPFVRTVVTAEVFNCTDVGHSEPITYSNRE